MIYLIIIVLLTLLPQIWVHTTYNKYASIRVGNGKNGKDVVESMLYESGIQGLPINCIGGVLTDHYNPRDKSINLSRENFTSASIAGVAVAAHETGHAIQDHKGYFFLKFRRFLGPITIVASNASWIFIYLGFLMFSTSMIWVGIILLGIVVLFDLVTLPVELNASSRAKKYLESTGTFSYDELLGVEKVLKAAAFTYIANTLAGILQLLRLLAIVKDND